MSKYNSSYNYISIFFNWIFMFYLNDNWILNEFVYLIAFNRWIWYRGIYGIFNFFCIGCMAAYTSGDYVYFKNMANITNVENYAQHEGLII